MQSHEYTGVSAPMVPPRAPYERDATQHFSESGSTQSDKLLTGSAMHCRFKMQSRSTWWYVLQRSDGEARKRSCDTRAILRIGPGAVVVVALRRHYARTLDILVENFEAKAEQVKKVVDNEKFRIWRVYLAGCAYAFENDDVSIYQVLCRKSGSSARKLPWSRRYMCGGY